MKMKMMLSAMLLAFAGVSSATGIGGADVLVTAGSSAQSSAFGDYTQASDNGFANGSAFLVTPGGYTTGSFGTQYSGYAFGEYQSVTYGQGAGGTELSVHHGNISADAGSGQMQESYTSGWYGYPYYYYGGQTAAQGSGFADVSGATWNANFSAGSDNAQSADSGWYYSYGAPSAIEGGSTASGQIVQSYGWHH